MRPADIVNEMKARAAKVRLQHKEWARQAKLDETTLWRVLNLKTDPLISTLDAMEGALAEEERKMRVHLNDLARSHEGRQLDMLAAGGAS